MKSTMRSAADGRATVHGESSDGEITRSEWWSVKVRLAAHLQIWIWYPQFTAPVPISTNAGTQNLPRLLTQKPGISLLSFSICVCVIVSASLCARVHLKPVW